MTDKVTIEIDCTHGTVSIQHDAIRPDFNRARPTSRAELIAQIVGPIIGKLMRRPTSELQNGVLADLYNVAGAKAVLITPAAWRHLGPTISDGSHFREDEPPVALASEWETLYRIEVATTAEPAPQTAFLPTSDDGLPPR